MATKIKIRKGDHVRVMTGKERGKEGRVLMVMPDEGRLLVEGVNLVKRHTKLRTARGRAGQEGGIIEKEAPIQVSNVQIVCPSCGPTRIAYSILGDGSKSRICRKCGGEL
ncbi:MAG TPA: 50S ribosomal protein L24 [Actinomycetota bacterium]|nr:50S ribosomal protein L24 [Actinomycetota bacterium]